MSFIIRIVLLTSLLGLAAAYAYGKENDALTAAQKNLLQQKTADSATMQHFADMCIAADSTALFLTTYKKLVMQKAWPMTTADLPMLRKFYEKIDTLHPQRADVITCYAILRIYFVNHVDDTAPEEYLRMYLTVARRLGDKCFVSQAYLQYVNFYGNIRHDLLRSYEYMNEIDTFAKKNGVDVLKECNINLYANRAVLCYYLTDYEQGIGYLDEGIARMKKLDNKDMLFDMYVRRALMEIEQKAYTTSLKTLDSAGMVIRDMKDNGSYLNYLYADSFINYVEMGDLERAKVLKEKVSINTLGAVNDEFYDYAFRLVQYQIATKAYGDAQGLIAEYRSGLKPWNIQRWKNAYEMSYKLNKAMGNTQEALSDYEQYTKYNDSVHHQVKHYAVIAQQIKFNTIQKEKELKLQRSVNEVQSKNIKLIIVISISICLLLLVALFYRVNKGLRERARLNKAFAHRLMEHTEQTQTRLAHELHDGLGQELLLLRSKLAQEQDVQKAEAVSGIIESVRGMARELYPALLDVVGLKATIENQLQKMDEAEDIFISSELEMNAKPDKNTQLQVYRIFQEAVANVLKYSGATSVYIGLQAEGATGKLTVKDNGKGFDMAAQMKDANTFGLKSMQQRAESIGAQLDITSAKGKGTEVTLSFRIV